MNSSQPFSRKIRVDQRIRLERCQSWEESFHVFDEESALAVEMALAAGRPLLVRGEPGSGKSQLARAAAQELNRHLIAEFISSSSEGQDLLWHYDPVARLNDVQIFAAEAAARAFREDSEDEEDGGGGDAPLESAALLPPDAADKRKTARYKRKKSFQQRKKLLFKTIGAGAALPDSKENDPLHPANYISPGALWWALDCMSAQQQYERCRHPFFQPCADLGRPLAEEARCGAVLLLDEMDKADSSLPNALLEVLGNGGFHIPLLRQTVSAPSGCPKPLVIITTNEERELPPAFVRRCFVLNLRIDDERQLRSWWARQAAKDALFQTEQFSPDRALVKWLAERGEAHFENFFTARIREKAAELLLRDRREARQAGLIKPGQAEYLDLLRALHGLAGSGGGAAKERQQLALLDRISPYALVKHPQA